MGASLEDYEMAVRLLQEQINKTNQTYVQAILCDALVNILLKRNEFIEG